MTLRLSMTFTNSLALTLVDTLLSLSLTHLAQFTASCFLTTYYRFHFAAACINATIIIMIVAMLAQVPTSVSPSLRGEELPLPHRGSATGRWERRIPPDQQTN